MAKNTTPETPANELDLSKPVTLSAADLISLFQTMQSSNAKTLAEAFEKLSPHYVSPEQKANQENLQKSIKNMEIFKLKNAKRQQRFCDHEIGQKGKKRLGEGSFFMLKLPTGETIGVCSYCQKVISSANPDDLPFFRKAGGTMAESGQFSLSDPISAQLARLSPDKREKILKTREEYKKRIPDKDEVLDEELI